MRVYVQNNKLNIKAENTAEGFQLGFVSKQLEGLESFCEVIHEYPNGTGLSQYCYDVTLSFRVPSRHFDVCPSRESHCPDRERSGD